MTTQMKQQLNPEARKALFEHFKNDDIKEQRLGVCSRTPLEQPYCFRLMMVSSNFCVAARHALRHSDLHMSPSGYEVPWFKFGALGAGHFAHEFALAIMSLVKPKLGRLVVLGSNELEPEIDEQFIRNHFVGIPKLRVANYDDSLQPHIGRLFALMAPKLKSLACSADYLKPTGNFPLLTLNKYKFCVDLQEEPVKMEFVLSHRIEKIQLDLVLYDDAHYQGVELSENCPVQPSLKVFVLKDCTDVTALLPPWFYTRVPNLKKQFHIIRLKCFDAWSVPGVIERLQTLAEHGEAVLQANADIEKLIYNATILSCCRDVSAEQYLETWQQSQFFTDGKFSVLSKDQLRDDEDALKFDIDYAKPYDVFVMSKGKMKFIVCTPNDWL